MSTKASVFRPTLTLLDTHNVSAHKLRLNEERAQRTKQMNTQDNTPPSSQPSPTGLTRLGELLGSPLGILLLIPTLVLSVWIFMAVQSQSLLQDVIDTMSQKQFFAQSQTAAERVQRQLQQAPPILTRWSKFMHRHRGQPPLPKAINHLIDLMHNRPSVSWISYSNDNGRFFGAFRNAKGKLIFSERQVIQPKTKTQPTRAERKDYQYLEGGLELILETQKSTYDHRIRKWYKNIKQSKKRIWSEPYIFFSSGVPGITHGTVFRDVQGKPQGALTTDFNLNDLSKLVEQVNKHPQGKIFLFTSQKKLLAYPKLRTKFHDDARGKGKIPEIDKHPDPTLQAFLRQLAQRNIDLNAPTTFLKTSKKSKTSHIQKIFFQFESEGKNIYAGLFTCPIDTGLYWYIGALLPSAVLSAPVKEQRTRSFRIALIALIISLLLAWLLARHVTSSRRALRRAQKETRKAIEEKNAIGSYTLVRRIGRGGMGEVWEGRHHMLARPAAIKLIRSEMLQSEEHDSETILRRFKREALATARLSSPHTVRLYDFGIGTNDTFFYVMELLEGMNLYQLIRKHGPQPTGRVIHILRQICFSLAEAHEKGLVHRDLKPANIFLCTQGTQFDFVKVLDFGVVQIDNDLEKSVQTFIGTPAFMAPEQIQGNTKLDGRTDIYALGCLGYWMLTGRQVFGQLPLLEMLDCHLHTQPDPPSEYTLTPVIRELEQLLLSCLAKSKDQRPKDAGELAIRLELIEVPYTQQWTLESMEAWWYKLIRGGDQDSNSLAEPVPSGVSQSFPSGEQDHLSLPYDETKAIGNIVAHNPAEPLELSPGTLIRARKEWPPFSNKPPQALHEEDNGAPTRSLKHQQPNKTTK